MPSPSLQFVPYSTLAESIAARLPESFGAWPEDVLVASNGVAQAIAGRLLERFPSGVAGLRLDTIERFAARILNAAGEYPRVATDEERRLAMRTAARSINDPLTETRGAAAMLERTYRDIRDSGLTIRDLSALRSRERIRVMTRVWEDYERLIARLGAIDPADLLRRAAELIRAGAALRPQIVAGFYDMTGAQMAVIDALRAVEKVPAVYIPVDPEQPRSYAFAQPFIRRFDARPTDAEPRLHIKKPTWAINEYKTREDEARGVCSAVRALLDSGASATSIGIVARSLDPYESHLLDRFAREAGFSISTGTPIPLVAHRIGRAVATLLRLRERNFPRGEVLEIARSGLKLNTRINADKADAETRQVQIAGGPSATLRAHEGRSFAVKDYIDLVAELEALTQKIDGGLLARLAESFRIEDETDLAAVEELDKIADLFLRAEKWNRPIDPAAILDALEQVQLITDNRQPTAVWAGAIATFRGHTFQHLFAIRMQDDVIPQRRVEDPLLPDSDRRAAGVREIGNGRDEEHLLFHLVCSGASDAIHFSYASSDGFGRPLRPSHYLKMFALEARPEKKGEILKNFSRFLLECGGKAAALKAAAPLPHSKRALHLLSRAGTESIFDGYIESSTVAARARIALQSISPTQLEDFGECPQKFLLKHILRVRDVDDPEHQVTINHRDKGTLDHRILERFYRSLSREEIDAAAPELPRLPQSLRDRLETLVDEQFDEHERQSPAHNAAMRLIERRATKRVLRDFVTADLADLLARGLTPAYFEYRFGKKHREQADHPEPFVVDVHGVALRVEGTIDRIDRADGILRIVDYKSGKALRHTDLAEKIDRGVRLQLALYSMAAAEFLRVDPADVTGTIKPLVRGEAAPDKFAFALGEKRDALLQTLEIFVDAILRGAFPAFPAVKDFESCKYCPVNHSCRTKHDADESRAVLSAGQPRTLLEANR